MSNKYRYDHHRPKHHKRHAIFIGAISLFAFAILAIVIIYLIDQTTNKVKSVSGPNQIVGQSQDSSTIQTYLITKPDYVFALPIGWKQTGSQNTPAQHSVSWQAFAPDPTGRYLTIYEDPVPTNYAINKLLPVSAHGSNLSFGSLSDNCSTFTSTSPESKLVPEMAKWQGVTFLCDTPNFIDNKVGTGSVGSPVNSVALTGPDTGSHHFFFLYIDRNADPDYTIFYSVLNSFTVK